MSHANIFKSPPPSFNVESFMAKDCMCNLLGSSTLRRVEGEKRNKFENHANTFDEACRFCINCLTLKVRS